MVSELGRGVRLALLSFLTKPTLTPVGDVSMRRQRHEEKEAATMNQRLGLATPRVCKGTLCGGGVPSICVSGENGRTGAPMYNTLCCSSYVQHYDENESPFRFANGSACVDCSSTGLPVSLCPQPCHKSIRRNASSKKMHAPKFLFLFPSLFQCS